MQTAPGENGLMLGIAGGLVVMRHIRIGMSMRVAVRVLGNPAIRL